MSEQRQKTECELCAFMWAIPMKKWSPHDRMVYAMHLTQKHAWVWKIAR